VALFLVLCLIGHIFIPMLLAFGAYEKKYSERFQKYYIGFPSLFWLWSNEEDGVLGSTEYKARYPKWSEFLRGWVWSAIRNPVNNLRFVKYLSCKIDPNKINFQGDLGQDPRLYENRQAAYSYFCWHGIYTSYRKQYVKAGKLNEFWIGWKLWPIDQLGVEQSVRKHGAGFAMQWREYTSISGTPY
jgi:hypothetical protein